MKSPLLIIVTVSILLFSPIINFAQAPPLGTAANFVLFSSDGAVTNGGIISNLTGNVGNNIGNLSGFGNVNGQMHHSDTVTLVAAADLLIAYDSLGATIANFFPVSPILGNGDTLVAGVYSVPAVTTLDSILFLDAEGDSQAVFIFKIGAAFSSTEFAKVKLINGAQACNVFWRILGAVTLDTGTVMKGNVIAHDAINMFDRDTLEGRALSTNGAITVSGVLAYTPTGCGSPALTGPIAPDLASTGCYAIFSSDGSVTNSGLTTHVTGDVGTNVTTTAGFNQLFVTGKVHTIPDSSTAECAADLVVLHAYLDSLDIDIQLMAPAQFGNELVLTPHTYLLDAETTFTGTVYLDARGDSNAVFVFHINGAFHAATFTNVELINGAKAKNVFWDVNGAVTIADSSVFNGTIVANNGAIGLGGGITINGRALTTTGAFSTGNVVVVIPPGTCNKILPVSMLYFRGMPGPDNVLLEWVTTSEINNGFFTIERSRDGNIFEKLTTVNAAPESNKAEYHYSYTDRQPYSLGYYRILQSDKDGQKTYFKTIQVRVNINRSLKVLKYSQGNYIHLLVSGAVPASGSIELYGVEGKKLSSQRITLTREESRYKIDQPLNKGVYVVKIISQGKSLYHGTVMVL